VSSKAWSGKSIEQRARDMIEAIDAIAGYIAGMDREAFMNDRKTISAVERELLTISEACARISELEEALGYTEARRLESRFPDILWHQIRGIGNILRHEYGRVDHATVWATIATSGELAELRKALEQVHP
jgi:uncharacterized protein with HEPN domain